VQGNGTSFNSTVEPVVRLEGLAGLPASKLYYLKCFTSTGRTQIPGALFPDFRDARVALAAWVDFANGAGLGPLAHIEQVSVYMMNYKFALALGPRAVLNLEALAAHFLAPAADAPAPPHAVSEAKAPHGEPRATLMIGTTRVKAFQSGKINLLGAKSAAEAERIYEFFRALFAWGGARFYTVRPLSDAERAAAAAPAAPARAPRPRRPRARRAPVPAPAVVLPAPPPPDAAWLDAWLDEQPDERLAAIDARLAGASGEPASDHPDPREVEAGRVQHHEEDPLERRAEGRGVAADGRVADVAEHAVDEARRRHRQEHDEEDRARL
jgi:hypothetical protein